MTATNKRQLRLMAVFLMGALIGGVFGTAITHDVVKANDNAGREAPPVTTACVETSRTYELTELGQFFTFEGDREGTRYQRLDEVILMKCRFRKTTVEVPR